MELGNMKAEDIARTLRENPELLKRVIERDNERKQRKLEEEQRKIAETEARRHEFFKPAIGAVIQKISQESDEDYEYAGETHIFTDRGKIIIRGVIEEIETDSK